MIAKDVKTGGILVYNNAPVIVENIQVQTPSARGAATLYKFRCRDLITRNKIDIKCKGTENFDEADCSRRAVNYSYADGTDVHFMDAETYDDYAISKEDVEWEMNFLKEGVEGIFALIYNDECVAINLPAAVELCVTKCDPAARGNSATSRTKPATVETGLEVQVPEYLEEGETIKVSTNREEGGKFLGRVNK